MSYAPVPAKSDFPKMEEEILRFWEDNQCFKRLVEKNRSGPHWSFLDGPITANNPMGVHHAWGRTYKDVFQRYHAMMGCQLRYQNGFDCQGLWVEVEVEKELGFKCKRDIEAYGSVPSWNGAGNGSNASPRSRPSSPSGWGIGWIGTIRISRCPTSTTTRSGAS